MSKKINLKGKIFNRWTVIDEAPSRNKDAYWLCQCECGTIREVNGYDLRSNKSKSCGCLQKEIISKTKKNDLINQRFGKLIVLYENKKRDKNGNIIWHCKCDCGNECDIRGNDLVMKKILSCGCLKSKGEEKICQILNENKISFEQQKTFNNCRNPETNHLFFFDFYIDNKYLIEFDGIQHFKVLGSWSDEEYFSMIQQHDKIKNQWCKENNIPLIRIPYTHYNDLSLEDLLLETSNFII